MGIHDILEKFRQTAVTERQKGALFEKLMQRWLLSDPRYCNLLKKVWLWEEFPQRTEFGGKDTGIDLVARTDEGDYWAIQCKFYDSTATIDKPAVDSFLSTSSKTFTDNATLKKVGFVHRLWISTTDYWGPNAIQAIQNQTIPVSRIGVNDLAISPVNWEELVGGKHGLEARVGGKQPMEHQLIAISKAAEYYKTHRRGKLIMACGTGKTYTSLKLVENQLNGKGLVLFMVPSIALLGQTLNAWCTDSDPNRPIKGICICSDNKANQKINKNTDDSSDSAIDLALPASTNPNTIAKQLLSYKNYDGLVVVFSTYQSIDVIHEAQDMVWNQTEQTYGDFDFIVCDEAHRTTGVILKDKEESHFTKIHDDDYIMGKYRLYMTATPRLYGESAKVKASEKDCVLCSMDDPEIYGEEFYRVNFSYAVQHGLLTDYKVLVLTVNEKDVPDGMRADLEDPTKKELNFDDTTKLIGVINGLAKRVKGDGGKTWEIDPRKMKRAVAFCSEIGRVDKPGSSKNVAAILPDISQQYYNSQTPEDQGKSVIIDAKHIDGSMDTLDRNERLNWLREEPEENVCKVVTNVRCLSEGVDVPALDAVLFLSAKNSQVDVVQSVGRIMRNFHKGEADEKKYGYIIIPIVVPSDVKPEDALNNNKTFEVVWSILNALRSHDDNFNAEVNKIALNKNKDSKVIIGGAGIGVSSSDSDANDGNDAKLLSNSEVAVQLELFSELQQGIYAKLVEKCGDRLYWENWSKEVGDVAKKFIERITQLVLKEGVMKDEFDEFLKGLQKNINPSVDGPQAIEMLAQHLITRPVFDALFAEYQFVKNNPVSCSMQTMIGLLEGKGLTKDLEVLDKFYDSVKQNVSGIDNLEGKQSIIKTLYEKFFKGAFPKTVEQLGIVYTPVECVDFIIRSVNDILKQEFDTSLTEENVHILDPFVGTGTFITRLLQSGLIKKEDMERKYRNEIHCNEIVLLAYYVADVNIESVFHDLTQRKDYLLYDGICLTDTFQLNETGDNDIFSQLFPENSERLKKQKKAPIRVVIGNPPYSSGQKSQNDNAQNLKYKKLDQRVECTYVKHSSANNKNSLYNSYIKAYRWASDRLHKNEGGVIAFVTPNSWIDGIAEMGVRTCFEKEFTDIYIFDLKGGVRGKSKEAANKEGENVFDILTGISLNILIFNPQKKYEKANIHYASIGDYLKRTEKFALLRKYKSISSNQIEWENIKPNTKNDWINQRDGIFDTMLPLTPEKKFSANTQSFFSLNSLGFGTRRDAWSYNFSINSLKENMKKTVDFYNTQVNDFLKIKESNIEININEFIDKDPTKISWSSSLIPKLEKCEKALFEENKIQETLYRPFHKMNLYYGEKFIHRKGQVTDIFVSSNIPNVSISLSGIGVSKRFSCLITKNFFDEEFIGKTQCFPLYWYEENKQKPSLFDDIEDNKYIRHDGVSDWILKEVRSRYGGAKNITKEHIFYYVYGLLHSEEYRTRFADDLRKSLPRIPIVEKVEDFMAFYKAGKALAELHLNYEEIAPCPGVTVEETGTKQDEYAYYAVEKMRFATGVKAKDKPNTILYNGHIVVKNIPQEAYDYVVNGKSAIEWIMERYAVTIDKESQIKNDPNDWSREHEKPRYILDLLLSIINVSVQTVAIVKSLPALHLDAAQSTTTQQAEERVAMPAIEIMEEVEEEAKFVQFLPYYNLKAACGAFESNELPTQTGWIDISASGVHPRGDKNYFVCQAKGNSMQPRIEDGDWVICRFYTPDNGGSRNGKMVIAQISEYDGDYDGKYTLKEYHSEKNADGSRKSITLRPLNKAYSPIELHEEDDVKVVAVVEAVLR